MSSQAWCEGRYPYYPPQSNAPVAPPPAPPVPFGSYFNLLSPYGPLSAPLPVNSQYYVPNGGGMLGLNSSQPSSQTQSPVAAEQRSVAAGDVFEITVGAGGPIYSSISNDGLAQHLQTTGIASDVTVRYSNPPAARGVGAAGSITITGRVNDDWPNPESFCAEVLKLTVEAGQPLSLDTLSCIITPTSQPAMSKFEVPGWLILLLLGGALWLWWKSTKEK